MITYIITAPLASWTTYQHTGSDSNSGSRNWIGDEAGSYDNGQNQGAFGYTVNANGGEQFTRSYSRSREAGETDNNPITGYYTNSESHSEGTTVQAGGLVNWGNAGMQAGGGSYDGGVNTYSNSGSNSGSSHKMAFLTAAPQGVDGAQGPAYKDGTYTQARFYNTFYTQTTTKTTVSNYRQTTTTQQKLAKVGTTTTQSIGTSVVTLPTTTNAKSWTETTATGVDTSWDETVVTNKTAIDSFWKKTSHTVYILGKGETAAFLKSNVEINATNGGPTDTKAFDTYSGPTTFTRTRNAGSMTQVPVIRTPYGDPPSEEPEEPEEPSQTVAPGISTHYMIGGLTSNAVYYYPGWPHHFPLSSIIQQVQTSTTVNTTTFLTFGYSSFINDSPITRAVWSMETKSYDFNGYPFTDVTAVSTTENFSPRATYPIPYYVNGVMFNGIGQGLNFVSRADTDSYSGSDTDGNNWGGGGGGAWAQAGNYWHEYFNSVYYLYRPRGMNAYSRHYLAWGTLGGTTATPRQSISVDGIASSESVTWPFVSISAGVATPKPFVTVSQKPETSATSSTAATKTEITKRRIWGEEFFKMTSSQNSSTGTSGSTITPIQAGGPAITAFELEDLWRGTFPLNTLARGWIPIPDMYIIGGIAQIGESTAIIPAGKYANTTLANFSTFQGSSIANAYFEIINDQSFICAFN
jgi:hypothetical protein